MTSSCDHIPWQERRTLIGIKVGSAIMTFISKMRRPGATLTGLLVAAFAIIQVLRALDYPSRTAWGSGPVVVKASTIRHLVNSNPRTSWVWAYIVLAALASAGSVLVAVGYRRLLTRQPRQQALAAAARATVRLVEKETGLKHHEIGVNVWLVKGAKGFRRLERAASEVAQPRKVTPIIWIKGKGIIGEAWARNSPRAADMDRVRRMLSTEEVFCSLPREDRFRLSWNEFQMTSRYHAVLAVPLHRRRFSSYTVKGVLAIDALVPGKASAIDAIRGTEEFSSIVRTCDAALRGEE